MHEEKGNKFMFGVVPSQFVGEDGHLTGVCLSDGQTIPADICLIGAGEIDQFFKW